MTDRSKTLEVMARAVCRRNCRVFNLPYDCNCVCWEEHKPDMEAALTAYESHLQAEGMVVVPRERMVDFFAEIDAAIGSVQGALRHYKQPQDVHFHLALKACH